MQIVRSRPLRRAIILFIVVVGASTPGLISCTATDDAVTDSATTQAAAHDNKLGDVETLESHLAAGLIGSAHDFTQGGAHARDLCTPCHTPHIADARAPLLDRRPVATGRLRSYQAIGVELDGSSLLCLSCHDGVIAPDVYTGAHATRLARQLGSSQLGIGGLSGHPIGVRYPTADPRYRASSVVKQVDGILLPDGRVQCISCHDPHNRGRYSGMLVRSNAGSRLCLSCHRL